MLGKYPYIVFSILLWCEWSLGIKGLTFDNLRLWIKLVELNQLNWVVWSKTKVDWELVYYNIIFSELPIIILAINYISGIHSFILGNLFYINQSFPNASVEISGMQPFQYMLCFFKLNLGLALNVLDQRVSVVWKLLRVW